MNLPHTSYGKCPYVRYAEISYKTICKITVTLCIARQSDRFMVMENAIS